MPKTSWDQDEYTEGRSFEVMPKGRYPCVINRCEEKKTQSGNGGKYWEFEFEVVKGDFAKRKLWARLNVFNPSDVAQRIGREQYKALAIAATGKEQDDTEKLIGKFVVCLVDIEQGPQGQTNRINGFMSPAAFKNADGKPPSKAAATAPATTTDDVEDDIPF